MNRSGRRHTVVAPAVPVVVLVGVLLTAAASTAQPTDSADPNAIPTGSMATDATGGAASRDPREVAREVQRTNAYPEGVTVAGEGGSQTAFPPPSSSGAGVDSNGRPQNRSGRGFIEEHSASDHRRPSDDVDSDSGWSFPSLSGLSGLGQLVTWGLIALTALGLLGLLAYFIYSLSSSGAPTGRASDSSGPSRAVTEDGLPFDAGDPDALAAAGRYSEAILALLVQSLRAVGWRPTHQRSRTAREVLGQLDGDDPRHPALGAVVDGAEQVRFAGAPATLETFQRMRTERDRVLRGHRGRSSARVQAPPLSPLGSSST